VPASELLSIVIPVYRSERHLERTVGELVSFLEGRLAFEIILVNDGSPDNVQDVIDRLSAADSRVHGIALGHNVGQHRATLLGFARARGDVVVTVDDDGQNPPTAVTAVREALLREDLDVVYGKFESVEQSIPRRAASWANRWLTAHTLQNRTGIAVSNVRALRGDLARSLGKIESPYPYIEAMVFRMASRIGEAPVEHRRREGGASNYTLGKLIKLWVSHLTSLSVLPLKFAMAGSFGISGLGFLVGVVMMTRALLEGGAPAGWLSLFCAVTFLFSVLFAFLGIVSAYLGRMYVSLNERGLLWTRPGRPSGSAENVRTPATGAPRGDP